MTNTLTELSHPDAPITRPGFHVTPEGVVIGNREVELEWQGAEDEHVETVDGVPVVTPPSHPNERTAFVSPKTQEDLRKEAGLSPNGVDGTPGAPGVGGEDGGPPPSGAAGAAAPAVTTSVGEDGNKRTVEHEVNVSGTITHEGVNALREAIEEAEKTMRQLDRS